MNPYMSYTPYMPQDAYMQDQMALRQRIDNLSQAQQQYNRYTTQLGLQNLQAQQSQCCCNTQKEILQSRYDAALQAQNMQAQMAQCCCDIKESILADGQATRQLIQDNTIQNLRDKLADRDRDLQTAYWQISQVSQTNNIIDAVRPTPKPAYMSCSPYFAYNAFGNGCCASGNVM